MSSNRDGEEMTGALVKKSDGSRSLTKQNLDFSDHPSFHDTVGRAVLGGAVGAILTQVASNVVGIGDSSALFTLAVTTSALAFVAGRGKKWLRALAGGALGALGGAAYLISARYPLFGAALLGAAAAPVLAAGETWKRMSVTGAFAGAFGIAGLYVGQWMQSVGLLNGILPEPIASAAAGCAVGLFYGLAAAPKHVARPADPVESAYLEALSIKDGELFEILARALSIHRAVKGELERRKDEGTVLKLGVRVGDLAMRILRIAEQCRHIESDLASAPAYELEERIESLRRKADAATDDAARATYISAVQSLDGQRKAFDAINRGRERVIARLHANVALLEKVRFSLLHLRSADAERFGGEASPLLDALEELSREIDATSTAVGEVFGRGGAETKTAQALAALPEPIAQPALAVVPREESFEEAPDTDPAIGVKDRRNIG